MPWMHNDLASTKSAATSGVMVLTFREIGGELGLQALTIWNPATQTTMTTSTKKAWIVLTGPPCEVDDIPYPTRSLAETMRVIQIDVERDMEL